MEENKSRKVVIMSMSGLLIGSLLYIFGISMKESVWPLIVNYIIALLLYLASFLAVFNNNKIDSKAIYKYIMLLAIALTLLISIATINQIM